MSSINSKMTALADAIRSKSGIMEKLSIDEMTTAVNSIVINPGGGGDIDLSFITAGAEDILSGKVGSDNSGKPVYGTLEITGGADIDFSDVNVSSDKMLDGIVAVGATGQKVTGNIPTVSASSDGQFVTIPAGFHSTEQKIPITIVEVDGDGYDTSIVTATADTMLSGVIAVGTQGETIIGNIESVTVELNDNVFKIEKGYIQSQQTLIVAEMAEPTATANVVTIEKGYNKYKKTVTIPEMTISNDGEKITVPIGYNKTKQEFSVKVGVDTSDATATTSQILKGATAYVKGSKITGNIKTVTASSNGETVTVPVGYIEAEQTFPVSTGSNVEYGYIDADGKVQKIDLSGDTPVASGEPVEMDIVAFVTGQDEPAYNPETPGGGSSSATYGYINAVGEFQELDLTGDTPSDIGSPVACSLKVFNTGNNEPDYNGAASSSGVFDLAKVTKYTPANGSDAMILKGVMATGYSDGEWSFAENEISFSGFGSSPKENFVYAVSGDRLIGNAIEFISAFPNNGLLFYASLKGASDTAETGQTLIFTGDTDYDTIEDRACANFTGDNYICASDAGFPTGTTPRTVAFRCFLPLDFGGDITAVSYGAADTDNKRFSVGFSDSSLEVWGKNNTTRYDYEFEAQRWYSIAVTYDNGEEKLYIDGTLYATQTHSGLNTELSDMCIGACAEDHIDRFTGSISDVMIYNRVLTDAEINEIANL